MVNSFLKSYQPQNFQGQLLVANPLNPEDNLSRGVILLINYSDFICLGLQINRVLEGIDIGMICQSIGIDFDCDIEMYHGGLLGTSKVHMIHSNEWRGPSTIQIAPEISVTSDISILHALSEGGGPELWRACVGHWSWTRKILDNQIGIDRSNFKLSDYRWEVLPSSSELVFDVDPESQWELCLAKSAEYQVQSWF